MQEWFLSFICKPPPSLAFRSHLPYDGGAAESLEQDTDRCSGVWCLTCSRSMRSSHGRGRFDSSASLTMITLSLSTLLKVTGQARMQPITRETWTGKPRKWISPKLELSLMNVQISLSDVKIIRLTPEGNGHQMEWLLRLLSLNRQANEGSLRENMKHICLRQWITHS